MSVVLLEKIRVFTPSAETDVLVDTLQQAGCLEIISEHTEKAAETASQLQAQALQNTYARIEMARTFFTPYAQTSFLRSAFEGGRAYTSAAELKHLAAQGEVDSIITQVESFQFRQAELERHERSLQEQLQVLHAWERLELPLNTITETKQTRTYALRGAERLLQSVTDSIIETVQQKVSITIVSKTTTLLTFFKTNQQQIEEIISAGGVEIVKLPLSANTAAQELTRLQDEQHNLADIRALLHTEIVTATASHLPLLQKMSDIARWNAERGQTVAHLENTQRMTVVTAWAPKAILPTLEQSFSERLSAYALEQLPVTDDEVVPTEITNKDLVKPFETVTRLYGSPVYQDLDPTPVLSIFFIVFFGICLSDAGYGLTLMALTGLILANYHLETGMKQLVTLMFYGGISTFFAGVLFGGYFGIDLGALTTAYPQLSFLLTLQKFDPINTPLPVFYLALILGFIHVAFGLCLNMYRKFSINERASALLDDAPWLYMFILIALYVANFAGVLDGTLATLMSTYTSWLFISAAALIVITQGRSQKNPIMLLVYGLLGLYGGVGYFADVLSYSRLMALGLATGALAFSINSIAIFVGGDSLGVGTIFMVFVLIFGHTLNIAISLMGTFINSARLQFVEFFSKFSTGTGRAFVPFRKEPRHVIILPDPPSQP